MQNSNGGGYNGNGHDPDEEDNDDNNDNVIRMPTLAERDKLRREQEKQQKAWQKEYRKNTPGEAFINLPPVTKFMVLAFITIHILIQIAANPVQQYEIFTRLGFIPAYYTGALPFSIWAVFAPLTYIFIHGSWGHLAMNSIMMTAFGTGMERLVGGRRMLVFFVLCSLGAAAFHLALNPFSEAPAIGASGGLSGMFAAILLLMQKNGMGGQGRYGIWPFVLLWVVISVLLGGTGIAGESGTIAWAAHIGGFLSGFIFLKPVMKYVR